MNRRELKSVIRECLKEVMAEGKRICAWCQKDMGDLGSEFKAQGDSHAICPDCKEKFFGSPEKIRQDVLKHLANDSTKLVSS